RIGDGANTYYNKNDFQVTSTPTRGTSNKITQEEVSQNSSTKHTLIISEVLPNPSSQNIDDEFIELYNNGENPVSLAGWTLTVSSGAKYIVPEYNAPRIEPKKYGALFRSVTHLALRNTGGDMVKLFSPTSEKAVATLSYRDTAPLGMSYMLLSGVNYAWTQKPTPGQTNVEVHANRAPEILLEGNFSGPVGDPLSFDASDTSDPDKDSLTFEWSFGDGDTARGATVQHMYKKDGSFVLLLSVGDGEKRSVITRTVKIFQNKKEHDISRPDFLGENVLGTQQSISLVLSEVVPNPKGADEDEFIELENKGNNIVVLDGWRITLPLQKREYRLAGTVSIAPHGFFSFTKKSGAFSLRNTKEQITLVDPSGKSIDEITYDDPPSAMSLSKRPDGLWEWTNYLTDGKANRFPKAQEDSDASPVLTLGKEPVVQAKNGASQSTLAYVRTMRSGTVVNIQGVVSVEPGILGEDKFYVAGSGIQIWNTNKQFPKLARGDRISVKGIIRKNAKEQSIKIASASDVHVVSSGDAPEPHDLELKDISDTREGWLVRIAGTVQKMQWPNIYLENGDATTRVYIAKTTGIEKQEFQKGDTLAVVGIVSQTQTGFRVLPRDSDDIVLSGKKSETVNQKDSPVSTPEKNESLDKPKEGSSIVHYIVVAVLGLLIVMGGLFLEYLRIRKEKNG
ncbi:MAG: lamin tail domain-containing protein, partial [bacterium]|nr:lamin tail domain-containing protein [bacterium]